MKTENQTVLGGTEADTPANPGDVCFVIGRPRSGTTVFKNMLQTHPQFSNMGEIFNEDNTSSYFHFLQRLQASDPSAFFPSKSIGNFLGYIAWCQEQSRRRKADSRFVVLDVKYDQAHLLCAPWRSINALPRLFSLIVERGWRVIDVRRNVVDTHVSNQIAMTTGVYHSPASVEESPRPDKIHIDPDALLLDMAGTARTHERVGEFFKAYGNYQRVNYEDMFDADHAFARSLLSRLSAFFDTESLFDPVPSLSKRLVGDVFSHIENATEIREVVRRKRISNPS